MFYATAGTRGRVFIADVGQNAVEEVSLMPPRQGGMNFGWAAFEGTDCYKPLLCIDCKQNRNNAFTSAL